MAGPTLPIWLRYADRDGTVTERTVHVHTFEYREGQPLSLKMIGYCSLRQAERTFRADRVISAADPDTGEIITNLPRYFADRLGKTERQQNAAAAERPRPLFSDMPALPRPPPEPDFPWPFLVGAGVVALLLFGWFAGPPTTAPSPTPEYQPVMPAQPPPPPIDLDPIAFWLGVGAGCLPDQARGQVSLRIQTLNTAGPYEYRAEIIQRFNQGMQVGLVTQSDSLCSRGLDVLDANEAALYR